MATAQAARAAGASRCGVVTAMGANAHSRIFYNRVKGEVERDLQALGFATLVIARPSLLVGERQALQQAARPAESLSIQLFKWLDPLIPDNYRARPGADVGRALAWLWRRLQGFTGDGLGATQQVCELSFYLGLALSL